MERRIKICTGIVAGVMCALILAMAGCNQPVEKNARDGIAAASGFLQRAVTNNFDKCQKDASQQVCVVIKRASQSLTVAIDALEAYCAGPGFNAGTASCQSPADPNTKQALASKLASALTDLNRDLGDVKTLTGPLQASITGLGLLSLIGLLLPILRATIAQIAPGKEGDQVGQVVEDLNGAVAALERVHNSEVTRAQLEGLKVTVPW